MRLIYEPHTHVQISGSRLHAGSTLKRDVRTVVTSAHGRSVCTLCPRSRWSLHALPTLAAHTRPDARPDPTHMADGVRSDQWKRRIGARADSKTWDAFWESLSGEARAEVVTSWW